MQFQLPHKISRTIFRTNDIRGNVATDFTAETVYAIGLALGSESKKHNQSKLIIACDGRLSSPLLSQALMQGIIESGCDVINIDAVPTPLMYFATQILDTDSGVILTGSHNPPSDNGLKIVYERDIASEEQILALFERIQKQNFCYGQGKIKTFDIIPLYLSYVLKDIRLHRELHVVIDCGNGIAGKILPNLIKRLGCDVTELYCEVDGNFPHHFPNPSIPENLNDLIQTIRTKQANIGIAVDNDGDRLGIVTSQGKIIWSDRLLMLFAQDILEKNPGSTIIYDVKCTRHLEKWIREHNGIPFMWKTGHALIKAKMIETNAILAGEMSGHFYFHDRWFGFDDALYAAARLLEILSKEESDLDEIFSILPDSINTPELKVAISDEQKFNFIEKLKQHGTFKEGKLTTLDGIRVDYDFGFGLVRASNTTPYLILRFEADTALNLKYIQEIFREELLKVEPKLVLPF